MSPPFRVGINRGQKVPQSLMQPSPPPQNLETIKEVVQELYRLTLDRMAAHNSISHI